MKNIFLLILFIALCSCGGGSGGGDAGAGNNTTTPTIANSLGDPLAQYAWHLKNTGQTTFAYNSGIAGNDLHMDNAWLQGYQGLGVKILISDSGVESTHEDLADNFLANSSYNYTLAAPYNSNTAPPANTSEGEPHGTMVAGIIASISNNNIGSRGVASFANIASANTLSGSVTQTTQIVLDQISHDFDIVNQSWGRTQCSISSENTLYNDQIKYSALNNRSGKGTVFVKSAGNDFQVNLSDCGRTSIYRVGNANSDPYNNLPEMIVVGAYNASGISSSYSSTGANLWISAPGGEYGSDLSSPGSPDNDPAILTTDRSGCTYGDSGLNFYNLNGYYTNSFDNTGTLNPNCNYTSAMNGTSASAPMISGAVAILLGVNPNLTVRDVKYILASTAVQLQQTITTQANPNAASPGGHVWEQAWITNSAGFKFHNWFGFGAIHVDNAVAMAKNSYQNLPTQYRTEDNTENWLYSSGTINASIPDNSASGRTSSIYISHNLKIEAVQIKLNISHANIGEVGIELTSPSGAKSILMNINNALEGLTNYTDNLLLSNAFYGESSVGNWTLKIVDGKAGTTGTLLDWKINIIGNEGASAPGPVLNLANASSSGSLTNSPSIAWDASYSHDVDHYEYSLGTSAGNTSIKNWTSVASNTSVTATGLSLSNGQTVFVNVRAVSLSSLTSVVKSSSWVVNTSGPSIVISAPSLSLTKNTNVTYTVTYTGATSVILNSSHITLNTTGTATGIVGVSGAGTTTRTVTISSISGDGTIGISIASGSADNSGSLASASSASTTFTVDNTAPLVAISAPSLSDTKNSNVTYIISYSGASSITLTNANVTLNKTGTANGTATVTGTGTTSRTVTISGITGDGAIGISIAANTATDTIGNLSFAPSASTTFNVDNTPPSISISSPSLATTKNTSVTYSLTYTGASAISLANADVTLNKTGTANGTATVTGTGTTSRTVTISGITGDGTIGISVAASTATDLAGNQAITAGPSTAFVIDSTPPGISISAPSSNIINTGPITYTVTYTGAASISLSTSDITLNKTGTANGTVGVSGAGAATRTVTISGITGNGTLGISIAANSAIDSLGNSSIASSASTTFSVDNTAPVLTFSAPSKATASLGPVTYTVTSNKTVTFSLIAANISLITTGTASGTISVSGAGNLTRTVSVDNFTGNGTLGISLAANIATDSAGNNNSATSNSTSFTLGCETGSQTLSYTGSAQQFTVPDRCGTISFTVKGGSGGNGAIRTGDTPDTTTGTNGLGVSGNFIVTAGELLDLYAGAKGANGVGDASNRSAGGGGGASAIIRNSNSAILVIAGGGSGGVVCSAGCSISDYANSNTSSSTTSNATNGTNGTGNVGTGGTGGWGYKNGGAGGKSSGGSKAFGGGGGGNPGGTGGNGTLSTDRGGNYYNSPLVNGFSVVGGSTTNGSITVNWSQ